MRKMNGKRFVLGLMALMMCLTMCAPAFASTGDRILVHQTTLDGYLPETSQNGDGLHLNGETFTAVMQYIRTHALP